MFLTAILTSIFANILMEFNTVYKTTIPGFALGTIIMLGIYSTIQIVNFGLAKIGITIPSIITPSIIMVAFFTIICLCNLIKVHFQYKEVSLADLFILGDAGNVAGAYIKRLPFLEIILTIILCTIFSYLIAYFYNGHSTSLGDKQSGLVIIFALIESIYLFLLFSLLPPALTVLALIFLPAKSSAITRLIHTSLDFITESIFPKNKNKMDKILKDIENSPFAALDENDELIKIIPSEIPEDLDIIIVQSETFFDIKKYENLLEKNGIQIEEDINYAFRKYKQKGMGGKFFVSAVGGGTSNTEFEFLTGLSAKYFFNGGIVHKTVLKDDTDTIAHFLKSKGYKTSLVHNYIPSFWNRNKNYPFLGFDEFLSIEDFRDEQRLNKIGHWMRDITLFEKVIEVLEHNKEKNNFIYAITVQNHSPFFNGADEKIEVTGLSKKDKKEIKNYCSLLKSSNNDLEKLMNYVDNRKKPTLVIYFGDHRPLPTYDIFRKSKYYTEHYKKNMHQTDYFMYFNENARERQREFDKFTCKNMDIPSPALGQFLRLIMGDDCKKTSLLYNLSKDIDTYLDPFPEIYSNGDLYKKATKNLINTK